MIGWYRLPASGALYHGELPPDVEGLDPPTDDTEAVVAPELEGGTAPDWYELPSSGTPYFGAVPEGANIIDAPESVPEPEPVENAIGWYRLDTGQPYYGVLPSGVTALDPAELGIEVPEPVPVPVPRRSRASKQTVDASESGATVNPDDAGVDLAAKSEQIVAAPVDGDVVEQDAYGDAGIVGHEG